MINTEILSTALTLAGIFIGFAILSYMLYASSRMQVKCVNIQG